MKCSYCKEEKNRVIKTGDKMLCSDCLSKFPRCMRDHINDFYLETLRRIDQTNVFRSLKHHNVESEIISFGEAALTNYYLKFSDVLIPLNRIASVSVFFRPAATQNKSLLRSISRKHVYGYVSMKITTTFPSMELQDVVGETVAVEKSPNHYKLNDECLIIGRKLRDIINEREENERQNIELVNARKKEQQAVNMYLRERERAEYAEKRLRETITRENSELYDAMILYMLEKPYTQEDIKIQRKRLMKSFHPDGNNISDIYAKKINDAYNVLLNNISR